MEFELLLSRLFSYFTSDRKGYSNIETAQKIFTNIYSPIVWELLPFMGKYNGTKDDKLKTALLKCKEVLSKNAEIANPVYLFRINCIINSKEDFVGYNSNSVKHVRKYNRMDAEKKQAKDKEYRKASFDYLLHEILKEYNTLRKILGLGTLNYSQKIKVDRVAYNDTMGILKTLNALVVVISAFAVIISVIQTVMEITIFF